ncbi:response regulator transcription factor [Merismopedia glauca]|uniref:DNA-binding response regulator n=1 Tax=Merismopedia glauca CCAP 1448/3 TaxID=1296344 RepID=A0A2T1C106_9CYAN|nr:response regulator transcription factor [Merismopedia glauca]PSB01956.1 DNA-binding response regulator [Merismopedia glauca CCAP 1448/3]
MKKILVVDDDRTLQTILTRFLAKNGYMVKVASSGLEGLTMFSEDPPDLVVSDVMMPKMNGLEFCRRLRASRSGQLVPFIFLSAKGEVEDRIQGHSMGADDYLTKPFEPRELMAKIEAQLERSRRIHSEMVRLMQQAKLANANTSETANDPSKQQDSESGSYTSEPKEDLPLTPAEIRVFWEVIQGFTNKQISERLFISPRTVQTHISNILDKLQLENRSQLVRFAYENGYRQPESHHEET